jgi:RimJ/RimL family protein N-acetyltransferase
MPAVPFPDPPLSDRAISLRPLILQDAHLIGEAIRDPLILRWNGAAASYRRPERYIARAERDRQAGRSVTLGIVHADVGFIGVVRVTCDWERLAAELSVWLIGRARGRSAGSLATRLVADWSLDALGIERLEVLTGPENVAAERAARNAGFTREGLLRGYRRGNVGREDLVMLARLRGDARPDQQP